MKLFFLLFFLSIFTTNVFAQPSAADGQYTDNGNLLSNGGAENGKKNWTFSGTGTLTVDSSVYKEGKNSIKIATTSGQTINLQNISTKNASQLLNVYGMVGMWISTTYNGTCSFCAVHDSAVSTSDCHPFLNTDGAWHYYPIPTKMTTTNNGVSLVCSGSTSSANTYVDAAYADTRDPLQVISAVGDWESCTVTGSWTTNTTYSCKKRKVGTNMDYEIRVATSGAPSAGTLNVILPSGDTIDTTKINVSTSENFNIGRAQVMDGGGAAYPGRVRYATSTQVSLVYENTSGTLSNVNPTAPITFGNTDFIVMNFSVPLVELNGNVTSYSSPYGPANETFFHAKISNTGTVSDETPVDWLNGNGSISDTSLTTFGFNLNIFTVAPTCFVTSAYINAGTASVLPFTPVSSTTSTGFTVRQLRTSDFVKSNQETNIICFKTGADHRRATSIFGSFEALNYVAVSANSTAGTTSITNSIDTIVYENEVIDTHGAYNPATGLFTAPVSGWYKIFGAAAATVTNSTSQVFECSIVTSNAAYFCDRKYGAGVSHLEESGCGIVAFMDAGDTANVQCQSSVTTTQNTSASRNRFSIVRIPGNI